MLRKGKGKRPRQQKESKEKIGNQLVNVCARNKHFVKSHYLFERLLQTLRLSFPKKLLDSYDLSTFSLTKMGCFNLLFSFSSSFVFLKIILGPHSHTLTWCFYIFDLFILRLGQYERRNRKLGTSSERRMLLYQGEGAFVPLYFFRRLPHPLVFLDFD